MSKVASFHATFRCEGEVFLKDDVGGSSAGRLSLGAGAGEDDNGMPRAEEGGITPESVVYCLSTDGVGWDNGEMGAEVAVAGRGSDRDLNMGETICVSASLSVVMAVVGSDEVVAKFLPPTLRGG